MRVKKLLFFGFLIGGLALFFRSDFFRVQKIICQLEDEPCPAEVWLDLTSQVLGRNIFLLSPQNLASRIKKESPLIKKIKVTKKIPNQVYFVMENREPEVTIKGRNEEFFVVDDEGYLLAETKADDLPLLIVDQTFDFQIGESLQEEEIIWSINLLKGLKFRLFQPRDTKVISSHQVETELTNGTLLVFSPQKDLDHQLDSLQLIFSRAKIEGKSLKRLDLRFDKPVATYE